MQSRLFPSLVVSLCLVTLGCSGTPTTPSPEQYFADAKNNLASLDYGSALKNLDRLIKAAGDQPLGQQGTVLRTALLVAMAEASKQMAEAYVVGVKEPPAATRYGQFSKMRSDYYGIARSRLLDAAESVMAQRTKLGDKPLPLEMRFPDFSGSEPPAIAKIRSGRWVEEGDRYRVELESDRNALARVLARLVGAGEDVHKGRAVFEKGGVQIDPRLYLIELSNTFLRLSEIFDCRALDDPRYRRIVLEVVRDNLDAALKLVVAKPDKDLEARAKKIKAECEKTLKTLGA